MATIARKKKTFGIKNKKLLERIGLGNVLILLLVDVIFLIEIYFDYTGPKLIAKAEAKKVPILPMLFYLQGTLILEMLASFSILFFANKIEMFSLKTVSILVPITVIMAFFSNLKPIPDEYLPAFNLIEEAGKYYYTLQPFAHWIVLFNSTFAIWILWKMGRIEWDQEPFEVIYGGEDSSTKKLLKII